MSSPAPAFSLKYGVPQERPDNVDNLEQNRSLPHRPAGLLEMAYSYLSAPTGTGPVTGFGPRKTQTFKAQPSDDDDDDSSNRPGLPRADSMVPEDEEENLDPDDPRLTGLGANRIDEDAWREGFKSKYLRDPHTHELRQYKAESKFPVFFKLY